MDGQTTKSIKNTCTTLVRKAKAVYWRDKFQKSNDSKSFWKTVKSFDGVSKSSHIGPLIENDIVITNNNKKAVIMNNFFSTIGSELALKIPQDTHCELNEHIYQVTPTP